jgi:FAD synthase
VLILPFDREMAALTGEEFFGDLLSERTVSPPFTSAATSVSTRARRGSARLTEIGRARGFSVVGVPQVDRKKLSFSGFARRSTRRVRARHARTPFA